MLLTFNLFMYYHLFEISWSWLSNEKTLNSQWISHDNNKFNFGNRQPFKDETVWTKRQHRMTSRIKATTVKKTEMKRMPSIAWLLLKVNGIKTGSWQKHRATAAVKARNERAQRKSIAGVHYAEVQHGCSRLYPNYVNGRTATIGLPIFHKYRNITIIRLVTVNVKFARTLLADGEVALATCYRRKAGKNNSVTSGWPMDVIGK